MQYDFSILCTDQLEKLDKRLTSLDKDFIKEYVTTLNVINNRNEIENREVTMIQVNDFLNDCKHKCEIFYAEVMNKIQRLLMENIK